MLLFLLFIFIFPLLSEACPNGSIVSLKTTSICYFLQNEVKDFIGAEEICIGLGGHLTSVHDMFENFYLRDKAYENFTDSTDFWFGANDLSAAGNWSWMDNTAYDFSDWQKGQPQNFSHCGAIRMQDAMWKTDDCLKEKSFICKTIIAVTPSTTTTVTTKPKNCPESWTFYNLTNFCYKVFNDSNWQNAENSCKIDNAHLASIHSFEEAEFVADFSYWSGADSLDWKKQAWIGLFTEDNNLHWQWTDGTSFDYPNWAPENPDYPGRENCVVIALESYMSNRKAGEFNNLPCNEIASKFVCKKSPQ